MEGIVSRRRFVRLATAGAIGTAALPLLLSACGGSAQSSASNAGSPGESAAPAAAAVNGQASASGTTGGGKLRLPTHVPFQGPKPDYAAGANGVVPPGYLKYPSPLVKSVPTPPGSGGTVSGMTFTYSAAPLGPDKNAAWAQVNKELNTNLTIPFTAQADYTAKLNTLMASGQLPDMFLLSFLGSTVQNEPQLLASLCADLTPYLSGDAVKAFPNLANLPQYTWKNGVYDNKLYMVPIQPGGISGFSCLANFKLLEPQGMTSFTSAADFRQKAKAFTQKGKRWMIGSGAFAWFPYVFRVPNQWRNDGGKLTKDLETEEYKATIAYLRQLWDDGVVYPDSASQNLVQGADNWDTGKYAIWFGGFTNYQRAWHNALNVDPNFKGHLLVPFPWDGKGKAVQNLGNGAYASIALKKASPARIKEVLGVLNYLSAPFGTQEAQLLEYGVENVDFKYDSKGNPLLTAQGRKDLTVPWQNLGTSPQVIYDPTNPEFTTATYKEESAIFALGVPDPVVGLYSPTSSAKGFALDQKVRDGVNAIIYGRKPLSSWTQVVADWRSGGGDQIRTEFEKALQQK